MHAQSRPVSVLVMFPHRHEQLLVGEAVEEGDDSCQLTCDTEAGDDSCQLTDEAVEVGDDSCQPTCDTMEAGDDSCQLTCDRMEAGDDSCQLTCDTVERGDDSCQLTDEAVDVGDSNSDYRVRYRYLMMSRSVQKQHQTIRKVLCHQAVNKECLLREP